MPVGVGAMLLADALSLPGNAIYYGLGASLMAIAMLQRKKKHNFR
jgi:hypothetical protein